MIDAKRTVGEIAARQPSTIQVLERLGIGYCCHGKETLENACGALSLPVDDVLKELNDTIAANSAQRGRWADPVLESLMGHLRRSSDVLVYDNLPQLQILARTVASNHGQEHPNLAEVARLTDELAQTITLHLSEEAQALFPKIRELELAYLGESSESGQPDDILHIIKEMVEEHEVVGLMLSKIRLLTEDDSPSPAGCATYRQLCVRLKDFDRDVRQEVHLENNILFNRALQLFGALYG